jgi:hypothetical protein
MQAPGYEHRTITKPPDWHGLVAWDMFFNNLTTGLFLAAALAELAVPEVFGAVVRFAYPIALVFLLIDLGLLVLDLGDPWRFHHMLRVFKPTSPMSLGTWCLTAYSLPLIALVAIDLFLDDGWAHRTALILGLLPALGSAVYKGVLLSTNAQPGWRDARWLGGYLTNSAFVLGTTELLILSMLLGNGAATNLLRPALVLLVAVNLGPLALLLLDLYPVRAFAWRRDGLLLASGTFLPVGLLMFHSEALLYLAALLILATHLAFRYVIIGIPHAAHKEA